MRRIATPDEIFDIIATLEGRKFATIGYVTDANINMPKVKRVNPETNRMKSYDDYETLGKNLGYEGEIGGIIKLTSYTMQFANREQMAKDYSNYKTAANDIRTKYGLEPVGDKENNYTQKINYGNGITGYGGDNDEKRGHMYYDANTAGAKNVKATYYVVDKEGHIDRECDASELKDMMQAKKEVSGVAALRKMGKEEEEIKRYIEDLKALNFSYKRFEYSKILYIVATVNGEKIIYLNDQLSKSVGDINIDPSEFLIIVKARYSDDLAELQDETLEECKTFKQLFESIDDEEGEMEDVPFMSDKDNLEKGMTLMREALKQYEEGKYSLANHNRKEANRFFDEMEDELSSEEGIEKAMYGESRNFGLIYNVIEENAVELYKTAEGRSKIGKILSTIKNSPILMNEFRVFNAFTNPKDVENAEVYVNEAISLMERKNRKEVIEENKKLLKLIKKLGVNEGISVDDEKLVLYETIEYTLFNKPTISNIAKYASVKKSLTENVERKNRKSSVRVNLDSVVDNGIEAITEKYNREMNEDEIRLVESFTSSPENAEKNFNKYKAELLEDISKKIEETSAPVDKEGWQHVYETVQNKEFDKDNVLSIVADMASIKEIL